MGGYGRIEHYDEASEDWLPYIERFEQYLIANDITNDEKRRAIFLTVLGPTTFGLLRSLVSPRKPSEITYDELVQQLSNHFCPKPSVIVERYKFNSRSREEAETVTTFVSALRKLSENCDFGTTLETMLRDRLVCGIREPQIQKRLLAEPNLTFHSAVELSLAMEAAAKDAADLQKEQTIHKIDKSSFKTKPMQQKFNPKTHKGPHTSVKFNEKPEYKSGGALQYRCIRCGRAEHKAQDCYHINTKCNSCGKVGHLSRVCISSGKYKQPLKENKYSSNRNIHTLNETTSPCEKYSSDAPEYTDVFNVYQINARTAPFLKTFMVNGISLNLEIDTGAAYSLIPTSIYENIKTQLPSLEHSDIRLSSYAGHEIKVTGSVTVPVTYSGATSEKMLQLLVVKQGQVALCGRNWIQAFDILSMENAVANSITVHASKDTKLQSILQKHKKVFEPGLGCLQDVKVHLEKIPDVSPKFFKARSIPYMMKQKVSDEIDRLQELGILEPVQSSNWAAPIVPVLKKDTNTVRICGDFKNTANKATAVQQYPLPKVQDLFSTLSGGKKFTKLDLRDAYNQLVLDEPSRELLVINTHKGLYRYTRLPFGVSSASSVFQRELEKVLHDVQGTLVFQDDLLVTGENDEDHLCNLEKALERIEKAGLRLRLEKCKFMMDEVEYLGHRISAKGVHPTDSKVQSTRNASPPENVEQLRAFIGLLTYYSRFIPNMAELLSPLYELTKANTLWRWESEQHDSFVKAKSILTSDTVLIHYDPEKKLVLHCDASPYGLGAVLSHEFAGNEQPIAYGSRTLTTAEKKYSQIEREALALVFAVTNFREYLLGNKFILYTDHRPLTSIFSETKNIQATAASRLQRWALTLAAYDYEIKFRSGKQNANADALSRLPIQTQLNEIPEVPELVLAITSVDNIFIKFPDLLQETLSDQITLNMDGQKLQSLLCSHTFQDEKS